MDASRYPVRRICPATLSGSAPAIGSNFAAGLQTICGRDSELIRCDPCEQFSRPSEDPGAPAVQEIPVQIELEDPTRGRIANPDKTFVIDEVIHHQRRLIRRPVR
jgi:hypothetical protein